MKHRGFTLVQALVIVAMLVVLWAILFPVFARRQGPHYPLCATNLRQLGLGFEQYTQDYHEKYPLTKVGAAPFGWADALYPYIKGRPIYQCSSEPTIGSDNPSLGGYTDYWFNSNLSGVKMEHLTAPTRTILSGDGNSGLDITDARYSKFRLPPRWIQDKNSPAYRHFGLANYAFADGHVRAMKPEEVSSGPAARNNYTFSIR